MAKRESVQKKLQRIRPPRVQLTYDVEVGDAKESKELHTTSDRRVPCRHRSHFSKTGSDSDGYTS